MSNEKKKLLGKKQIIMSLMLVVLAGAIFVNWKFSGSDGGLNLSTSSEAPKTGNAEFVATSDVEIDTDYFDNARKDREATYNDAIKEYEEIEDSATASENQKADAYKSHIELVERQEKQSDIESLIKAKGFKECLAVISDASVNVVVYSEELAASEILQIQDIVTSVHETQLDNIKIININ